MLDADLLADGDAVDFRAMLRGYEGERFEDAVLACDSRLREIFDTPGAWPAALALARMLEDRSALTGADVAALMDLQVGHTDKREPPMEVPTIDA